MPPALIPITLTVPQAKMLALVGQQLRPQVEALFDHGRYRAVIERTFDLIDDRLGGATPDPFDVDLENFAEVFGYVRSHEFAEVIRTRMRDLIAVTTLWRALEDLSGVADTSGLLGVPAIDSIEWRAEVLDLLLDRGVEVTLPGEGR